MKLVNMCFACPDSGQIMHIYLAGVPPKLVLSRLHKVGVECASYSQSDRHASLEVLCHLLNCLQAATYIRVGNVKNLLERRPA